MLDFDDISILFTKMQMKSCSRLGSKHQQKLFLEGVLYMYVLPSTNIAGIKFSLCLKCCGLANYGHGVSEV